MQRISSFASEYFFSVNYEQYFPKGDYESAANVYRKAQVWARQNGHSDIDAGCEHYISEVYYYAARYSPAFEHLLRTDYTFREIGYEKYQIYPPICTAWG